MATELEGERPDPTLAPLVARLEDREPDHDLWPGIANRLRPNESRMLRLPWPIALAATLTLVASTSAITMLLTNGGPAVPIAPAIPVAPQSEFSPSLLPAGYATASVTLTKAIDRLEQVLAESSTQLDPSTRQRIAASIDQLDEAIAAARRQVNAAPGSFAAARYLTQTMERKLNVLEQVTTLMQQG